MSRRILAHIAAMRRQVRRIQRTAVFGAVAMIPCAALLFATTPPNWLSMILLFTVFGYLQGKIRRLRWAHRSLRQLRLEDQFVRHSPTAAHVRTCTRHFNHLWRQSLTLQSLKTLTKDLPAPAAPAASKRQHVRRHFMRAYDALRPARLPADLIWFAALGMLWIWLVPAARPHAMTTTMFVGAAFLLFILVAEVIQEVLHADFRGGLGHFVTLLSEWTLNDAFEDLFVEAREKPYRHTRLYHTALPSLAGLKPLPMPDLEGRGA